MLFNTREFAVFFLAVCGLAWLLWRTDRPRLLLLLAASYLFYGWWDVRFLFLIVVSTGIDYGAAMLMDRGAVPVLRRLQIVGAVAACALLCVYPDWEAIRWGEQLAAGFGAASRGDVLALVAALPPRGPDGALLPGTPLGRDVLLGTLAGAVLLQAGYALARRLPDERRRKVALTASVVSNLSLLGFFKYYNFFTDELSAALAPLGVTLDVHVTGLVLPVGISFYTFQTLSYTIDVHRRALAHEPDFTRFALFVAFFPQLVAGPIVRARDFLPQLRRRPALRGNSFESGIALIFWGLLKKVAIADTLGATLVDPFWREPGTFGGLGSLIAIYGYAFQIYGDFSGYSDIAIGTARLLGFELGENFRSPYRALGPREFWTRWHISLSSWLRDYLYIPLGGNRGGSARTYRNLVLTMLLGGLWHGASWMFVIWGAIHGLLLVADRLLGLADPVTWWGRVLRRAVFFQLVCLAWVFFRSPDGATALAVLGSLAEPGGAADIGRNAWLALLLAAITHFPAEAWKERLRESWTRLPAFGQGFAYALVLGLLANAASLETPFIYFQF